MAKTNIKIGHLKITDHLVLGITQAKLKSGKESFQYADLSSQSFMGWNQITDAFKSGQINAACMLAPTAMDLFSSGVDINLVLLAHKTGSIFVKNKAANIEKVSDLKGKTIAIPFQLSVHHMLLHKLLTENGLTPGAGKDVTLEVMAPAQMPQAIEYDEDGECGGFIVAEPFGSQAIIEGYGEQFYLSKELWPNHPCCVVVVNKELAEQKDAVQELVDSFVDSGMQVSSDTAGSVQTGAEFLGQKPEVVQKVLTEPKDRVMFDQMMPVLEDLDSIQSYMSEKMGLLSGKIDLEKFVDTSFAKNAGAA